MKKRHDSSIFFLSLWESMHNGNRLKYYTWIKIFLKSKNAYLCLIFKKSYLYQKKIRTVDHIAAPRESNDSSMLWILHPSSCYPQSVPNFVTFHILFLCDYNLQFDALYFDFKRTANFPEQAYSVLLSIMYPADQCTTLIYKCEHNVRGRVAHVFKMGIHSRPVPLFIVPIASAISNYVHYYYSSRSKLWLLKIQVSNPSFNDFILTAHQTAACVQY